jgi:hypothetical protein
MSCRTALVLFSGGSDCTLAAAQVAQSGEFDEIVLMTYEVPVSCLDGNSKKNIPALQKAFPSVAFTHAMKPVGNIIDKVISKRKLSFVLKHGLIEASFCLHCRLGMHVCTIMYCLDNGIKAVFDGSNITMALWVDQTREGIEMVDRLYAAFGITIAHPVFYYGGDDLFNLVRFLSPEDKERATNKSTSSQLHEMGIVERSDHKSDLIASYRAQPVCLGVVMSLMHSLGTCLPFQSYEVFNRNALRWYADKTALFEVLLHDYQKRGASSELGRLV